jgi:pSer/pThr/pTyr-binding forkhead associated (FHA) protein
VREIVLGEANPVVRLGRDPENDVVIADRMASRLHARIERRRDKFVLVDQSSNGTYVTVEGEPEIHVRREEIILHGRGQISFGHAHAGDRGSARVLLHPDEHCPLGQMPGISASRRGP